MQIEYQLRENERKYKISTLYSQICIQKQAQVKVKQKNGTFYASKPNSPESHAKYKRILE